MGAADDAAIAGVVIACFSFILTCLVSFKSIKNYFRDGMLSYKLRRGGLRDQLNKALTEEEFHTLHRIVTAKKIDIDQGSIAFIVDRCFSDWGRDIEPFQPLRSFLGYIYTQKPDLTGREMDNVFSNAPSLTEKCYRGMLRFLNENDRLLTRRAIARLVKEASTLTQESQTLRSLLDMAQERDLDGYLTEVCRQASDGKITDRFKNVLGKINIHTIPIADDTLQLLLEAARRCGDKFFTPKDCLAFSKNLIDLECTSVWHVMYEMVTHMYPMQVNGHDAVNGSIEVGRIFELYSRNYRGFRERKIEGCAIMFLGCIGRCVGYHQDAHEVIKNEVDNVIIEMMDNKRHLGSPLMGTIPPFAVNDIKIVFGIT